MNVNNDPPGDSVVGSWIAPDASYAFVEFRTSTEATNGLIALGNVAIYGKTLKVGRPK